MTLNLQKRHGKNGRFGHFIITVRLTTSWWLRIFWSRACLLLGLLVNVNISAYLSGSSLIAMHMSWWEATITIIMFTKSPRGVKAYNYNDWKQLRRAVIMRCPKRPFLPCLFCRFDVIIVPTIRNSRRLGPLATLARSWLHWVTPRKNLGYSEDVTHA